MFYYDVTLEITIVGIKKGFLVKMSTALLVGMNSLCQMLDTACVRRALLKNYHIYMTKADGFRVLKRGREGGEGGE